MIVLVSGLPRSGTSLMMQMLAAGGMEVLTDGERKADDDNPRGYYELERVKQLKQNTSWMAQAEGKVVKIISMLLYDLPEKYSYKVVFMQRRMKQVLASQQTMLERRGVTEKGPPDAKMAAHFEKHLAGVKTWLAKQPHFATHYCDYNELLQNPEAGIKAVCDFLDASLDQDVMRSVIDPKLNHQNAK